ncbi:hypothetical protein GCM10010218_37960 [Streptomyces mashuensis]|uniref:Uncharacterized protein n=1 Tax=Streptomyces mashuensis TaxID=33904 RepID=A0A919B5Y8_9ACTN|nr:hypothetical protein [Streptomyces mashuensis]GHF52909.1 hypothetical protein GCM10010218_37960 [Streptomyces mashuensis]
MTPEKLRALLKDCTKGGTLTLPADRLGDGTAARLLRVWLGGSLVVGDLRSEDGPGGAVVLSGTMTVLRVADQPVTGLEIGLKNGEPTLHLPFALPVTWRFGQSFGGLAGTDLDKLAWRKPPAFLFTSHQRSAHGGGPVLAPGLTFLSTATELPRRLTGLIRLLEVGEGTFRLSGPVLPGPAGVDDDLDLTAPLVRLRSPAKEVEAIDGSFHLAAGSCTKTASDALPGESYELRLVAALRIGPRTGIVLSAPTSNPAKGLTFIADTLPTMGRDALAGWNGTADAMKRLKDGFGIGRTVRLSGLALHLDPSRLGKGPAAALTRLTARVSPAQAASWQLVDGRLVLQNVGADLSAEYPLAKSGPPRSTTVTGTGELLIPGSTALQARAVIPPGEFSLTLAKGAALPVKDVVRFFSPDTNVDQLPGLVVTTLRATAKAKEFSFEAGVGGDWRFGVAGAEMVLDKAVLKVDYGKGTGYAKGSRFTGELSARARMGPAGGGTRAVSFDAALRFPGRFAIGGELADLRLERLLAALLGEQAPQLPPGLTVALVKPQVELTVGPTGLADGGTAPAGPPTAYDLVLRTRAQVGSAQFTCFGRAGRDSTGALFAAALWYPGTWSPADVTAWRRALGDALKGIAFQDAGFAVCTRDGIKPTGDKLPDTVPKELERGVTFFGRVRFGGVLAPLSKLFSDGGGVPVRALIASSIGDTTFVAEVAQGNAVIKGLGPLKLALTPVHMKAALRTSLAFSVPTVTGTPQPLVLTAGGMLSLKNPAFRIFLVLNAAATEAAGRGDPAAVAFALDAPVDRPSTGHLAPGLDPGLRKVCLEPAKWEKPPEDGPLWRDALGIRHLDVAHFYVEAGYAASGGLTLGMGGKIKVGRASLVLDVHGGYAGEPYVDVFRFSLLATAGAGRKQLAPSRTGVSLWDILRTFAPDASAPAWLKAVLDGIVLRELQVVFVAKDKEWQSPPPLKEKWGPGLAARGDVDIFGVNWRFALGVAPEGIHAANAIDKPVVVGSVLRIHGANERTGPSYFLDTRQIQKNDPERRIFHLAAGVKLLGAHANVRIELRPTGWYFLWRADLVLLRSQVQCTYRDGRLQASASLYLDLTVRLAKDIPVGKGITIPKGQVGVRVSAAAAFAIDGRGCAASLTATCTVELGLGSLNFPLNAAFSIGRWEDIPSYLLKNPDVLFKDVAKGLKDFIKNCALTKAAQSL